MQKVLKEMVDLLYIYILQGYGRMNSTMFIFLRRQGWGFAVHVLLLNKKGINVKGQKEVYIHNINFKNWIVINYENIFINRFFYLFYVQIPLSKHYKSITISKQLKDKNCISIERSVMIIQINIWV